MQDQDTSWMELALCASDGVDPEWFYASERPDQNGNLYILGLRAAQPDLEEEEWRYVHFNTDYLVSNMGRVKSLMTNRMLTSKNKGYPNVVKLRAFPGATQTRVCRIQVLVLSAFVREGSYREKVEHIDGNVNNNRLDNIYWRKDAIK